jgi:hypothetical protein
MGSLTNKLEFGTAYCILLRIKANSSTSPSSTKNSEEEAKDQFYEQLEREFSTCPKNDVELVMGDANAKIGRKAVHQPTIGRYSLHDSTNDDQEHVIHAQTKPP